jgi:type II secretory pathway pseudopilin PulG
MNAVTFEPRRLRRRVGLGIVEALIALAICASLLTAVAAAFRASGDAIDNNDQFFTATQAARVAMNRILTQVRRGTPANDSTATNLHLLTDTGLDINYHYDSGTKQLSLVTTTSTLLVHDAKQCAFGYTTGNDAAGNPCVLKVTCTISVQIGDNTILFSGSACPRRSLAY